MNYLKIPDSDLKLTDGSIVILERLPGTKWVVHYGWYDYSGRRYSGWYFCSIPSQTVIPVTPQDLQLIVIVDPSSTSCNSLPAPTIMPGTTDASCGTIENDISSTGFTPESDSVCCPPPTPPVPPLPPAPPPAPPPLPPVPPPPMPPPDNPEFFSKIDQYLLDSSWITLPSLLYRDYLSKICKIPDGKVVKIVNVDGETKYYSWNQYDRRWDEKFFESGDSFIIGLDPREKILSVKDRLLNTSLSIETEIIDEQQYIVLRGVNHEEVSRLAVSDFVNTGVLTSVTVEDRVVDEEIHKFLVMTFTLSGGEISVVEIDLNETLSTYDAKSGGGLQLDSNNEFSISNTVTPEPSGVNTDATIQLNSSLVLYTITYDSHGLITGKVPITLQTPSTFGESGVSGEVSKVLTYVYLSPSGILTGETADVESHIDDQSTDTQIPTAKAVYETLSTKQDVLTFDSEPTEHSENPVTSGGLYSYLNQFQQDLEDYADRVSEAAAEAAIDSALETGKILGPSDVSTNEEFYEMLHEIYPE